VVTEYVGRGDAVRTMALLWRTEQPPRRGPKQRLDVDRIVTEAVALADRDGLGKLSMRRVAEAVGLGTMSLYTYVPGKAELLELMVDRVVGSQPLPQPGPDWRAGLEAHARATWDLHRRHPWLVQVAASRTVFGPNVIARFDAALGVVGRSGLPAREVVAIVSLIEGFVRGAASALSEAEQATVRTGQAEDEWWEARAPLLDEQLEAGDYPHIKAMAEAGAFEQSQGTREYYVQQALDEFEFGLARLLDGIAVLLGGPGSS
jgi:AcrR family transcriptional regulator